MHTYVHTLWVRKVFCVHRILNSMCTCIYLHLRLNMFIVLWDLYILQRKVSGPLRVQQASLSLFVPFPGSISSDRVCSGGNSHALFAWIYCKIQLKRNRYLTKFYVQKESILDHFSINFRSTWIDTCMRINYLPKIESFLFAIYLPVILFQLLF